MANLYHLLRNLSAVHLNNAMGYSMDSFKTKVLGTERNTNPFSPLETIKKSYNPS